MGAGPLGRTPFPAQPGSAMLRVTFELGKEAGNVCLRRDRRAPQALPAGGHRRQGRGARQPQRAERGGADLEGDRRAAAGDAGGVRGRVRHRVAGGAARGLRLRAASGAPAAVQGDRLRAVEERQGPAPRSWRSCCARTCSRKPGSRRRRCASCGRCCGTGSSWCGCGRCCATGSTPCWPATAARPGTGAGPAANGSSRSSCPPPPARWPGTAWR